MAGEGEGAVRGERRPGGQIMEDLVPWSKTLLHPGEPSSSSGLMRDQKMGIFLVENFLIILQFILHYNKDSLFFKKK